jgi:hypothetical protein
MLSDADKAQQRAFNRSVRALIDQLHDIGGSRRGADQMSSRQLAYARTKLEEADMWVRSHYHENVSRPAQAAAGSPQNGVRPVTHRTSNARG